MLPIKPKPPVLELFSPLLRIFITIFDSLIIHLCHNNVADCVWDDVTYQFLAKTTSKTGYVCVCLRACVRVVMLRGIIKKAKSERGKKFMSTFFVPKFLAWRRNVQNVFLVKPSFALR